MSQRRSSFSSSSSSLHGAGPRACNLNSVTTSSEMHHQWGTDPQDILEQCIALGKESGFAVHISPCSEADHSFEILCDKVSSRGKACTFRVLCQQFGDGGRFAVVFAELRHNHQNSIQNLIDASRFPGRSFRSGPLSAVYGGEVSGDDSSPAPSSSSRSSCISSSGSNSESFPNQVHLTSSRGASRTIPTWKERARRLSASDMSIPSPYSYQRRPTLDTSSTTTTFAASNPSLYNMSTLPLPPSTSSSRRVVPSMTQLLSRRVPSPTSTPLSSSSSRSYSNQLLSQDPRQQQRQQPQQVGGSGYSNQRRLSTTSTGYNYLLSKAMDFS